MHLLGRKLNFEQQKNKTHFLQFLKKILKAPGCTKKTSCSIRLSQKFFVVVKTLSERVLILG